MSTIEIATVLSAVAELGRLITENHCADEEEEEIALSFLPKRARPSRKEIEPRKEIVDSKKSSVKDKDFVKDTVPLYSPSDFKFYFRMNKTTVEYLLNYLLPVISHKRRGRPATNPRKKLLSVLWFLGNQESFRLVAERFNVTKSCLYVYLSVICGHLCSVAGDFISWPEDSTSIERSFYEIAGFPGVVGAIDCCHIRIKAPHDSPKQYFNRKKYYSLILQGIALPDLTFSHVSCAYPGSVLDAGVFINSEVYHMCDDANFFSEETHLVGNEAYPLLVNLLVPFKDNGCLTNRQEMYNEKLLQSRVCIETAFGLLKYRFQKLKCFDADITKLPMYIVAVCVLHNMCIQQQDAFEFEVEDDEFDALECYDDCDNIAAQDKRNYICSILNP